MKEIESVDNTIEAFQQELRRGTLVLSVLSQLKEEEYGYTLSTKLQEKGLEIEQNTLYPLLRRLEGKELLMSTWKLEDSRQRRYYQLTDKGRRVLKVLVAEWEKMVEATEQLINEEEDCDGTH